MIRLIARHAGQFVRVANHAGSSRRIACASQNLLAVGAAIVVTGTAANALLTQLKTACGS